MSRRQADRLISSGQVKVNAQTAELGYQVNEQDTVMIDGKTITTAGRVTVMLNKPEGYVCSRRQQGDTQTVYELLPNELYHLKPVGRLDKNSRGLLLLTNDGELAYELTHPKHHKLKTYEVRLDHPLEAKDMKRINSGVMLPDGQSNLEVKKTGTETYIVKMTEGRNRQIRRTFSALGYEVVNLLRLEFGSYKLGDLKPGEWKYT